MRRNGSKKLLVFTLLLMVIIGQNGLTFSATAPSTLDITSANMLFNLTEGESVNFLVNATYKSKMIINWTPVVSADSQLKQTSVVKSTKTVRKVVTYYEQAKYLFEPQNVDAVTTYTYTISVVSNTNASLKDQITVTFVVSPIIVPENRAPVAVDDSYTVEVGKTLVFKPLLNDSDPDGDAIALSAVLGVDNLIVNGSEVSFTPLDSQLGSVILSYSVSDGALMTSATITIHVIPMVVDDKFVYVALGDSIPSGVSYEGSLTAKTLESYSDKLAIRFDLANNQFEYFDYAVSGYNAIDVYNQVNNSAYQNAISQADVITLCVGANDIMDAAKRNWTGSINFYSIDWIKADAGRLAFEVYWPQIIRKIQMLNPDVDLMVSTIYNPYNKNDAKTYNKVSGQNASLLIHDQVDLYLWNDTQSKLGLNTIIANYHIATPLTLNYIVINVHELFESNYLNSKGSVTGFYGNWVQDPHPDKNGQKVIYDLHVAIYQ